MIHTLHQIVWGPWLLAAFLAAGVGLSVRFRLFQILHLKEWLSRTAGSLFSGAGGGGHISQFATVCTALAATVGTGNIVGVATAITAGGPGALFWMWVSAFLGMMTAYAEVWLGIRYRFRRGDGRQVNGPMAYMERGAGSRGMAGCYALLCLLSSLGMGSMVQANSIAESLSYTFCADRRLVGAVLTALVMAVILGGVKRIAGLAEKLVPLSAGIYMAACLVIVGACFQQVPGVRLSIFKDAFRLEAAAGGAAGYGISRAMQYGLSRGVFSNEAGLGSLAVLHGTAGDTTPEEQGMWAMFEVFFDTILSCTLTALAILCTLRRSGGPPAFLDGGALTAYCFSVYFGRAGEYLIAVSMALFAFSTIIAWFYLGSQALGYLSGERGALCCYGFLYLNAVCLGCLFNLRAVWELSDILNGLMAVPNLIALLLLARRVKLPKL